MVAVVRTRVARTRFTMGLAVALFAAGVGPVAHAASIETIAKQAILVDITSNTVLFEKSPDQRMAPSSMSKIMTMYMVFDAIKEGRLTLESTLPVSERAWRMQGSKMFVELHNNIKVDDLIKGVIVQSGNDACIVFAEGLAGSESAFAERMNKRARELGLKDTNLTNATGWPDPNHYMTARDLSILAEHLIKDFPEYYHYYSIREFKYHGINQGNRNPLLYRGMDVDGMKTGHTEAGGYGLTASAEREGRRLILVVNGLPSMQAPRRRIGPVDRMGLPRIRHLRPVQGGRDGRSGAALVGRAGHRSGHCAGGHEGYHGPCRPQRHEGVAGQQRPGRRAGEEGRRGGQGGGVGAGLPGQGVPGGRRPGRGEAGLRGPRPGGGEVPHFRGELIGVSRPVATGLRKAAGLITIGSRP